MVMVSWPELVCAPALTARRQSMQLNMSALVPPKLKLQFIASKPAKPQVLLQCPGPGFPGPRYSVLRAAGTLVFRAGKKSKRNLTFRKQYFSHHWRWGKCLYLRGLSELKRIVFGLKDK